MEKLAVRKVTRKADGKTEVEIIDLATNKPIKDTKGYTIISAQDSVKQEKPDPKKPYAMRRVRFKEDGMLETIFVDSKTGEEVHDLSKYNVMDGFSENLKELNLLPKEEVKKAQEKIDQKVEKEERSGEYYSGIDPNSPKAKTEQADLGGTGYVSESSVLNMAKSLPGMVGLGAKGLDIARRINNASVVNKDRKSLGVEEPAKGLGPGQVGDVKIGDKTYPVGYEAEETKKEGIVTKKDVGRFLGGTVGTMFGGPIGGAVGGIAGGKLAEEVGKDTSPKRTNLTPEEARRRQNISAAQALTQNVFKDAQVAVGDDDQGEVVARGLGLQDLSPSFKNGRTRGYSIENTSYSPDSDLEDRPRAFDVEYSLEGKGRSLRPSSGIEFDVAGVVRDVLGPGYSVDVTSGQEPPGRSPVGSKYRHPLGLAADLKIKDPNGRVLNVTDPQDAQAIKDVAVGMAARHNANFGMGLDYMGPETMHIDKMDLSQYPGGPQWGGIGRTWADDLSFAREEGVMPSQYYDVESPPIPQARPSFGDLMASVEDPRTPTRPEASTSVDLGRRMSFSDEDIGYMGATLAGEIDFSKTDLNTPEGIQEARGILSTMENRRNQYGSIKDAVMAPNQYSTWNSDIGTNTALSNYEQKRSLIDNVVRSYITDPQSNMGFTHYYNASLASPGWGQDLQKTTNLGPHRFGFLGDYKGAFGTNFGATEDTQKNISKPTANVGSGTGASASAKVSLGTAATTSASVGPDTSRGIGSDENANRSSMSSRNNEDRSKSTSSSSSSSSGRGSYSSGIGGSKSSLGSSSGFGSYSRGADSAKSYGSSSKSSLGSSSGFGGYSRGADSARSYSSSSTSSKSYNTSRNDKHGW